MSNAIAWSIEHSNLTRIIFEIQQEVPFIGKDSTNPHFKSKYASLEDIWSTLRPVFLKHGIMVSQVPGCIKDGAIEVVTQIIHVASGEFLLSCGYMPMGKEGPQAAGSAITYARRYFLCPLLGIVAGEDDDAEQAEGRPALTQAQLEGLRKRKDAVMKNILASAGENPITWMEKVLQRKLDDKMTLRDASEIVLLENAIGFLIQSQGAVNAATLGKR
jgi:hypothetical protein